MAGGCGGLGSDPVDVRPDQGLVTALVPCQELQRKGRAQLGRIPGSRMDHHECSMVHSSLAGFNMLHKPGTRRVAPWLIALAACL